MSLQLPEESQPSNPPLLSRRLYVDTVDGKFKIINSAGTIVILSDLVVPVYGTELHNIKSDNVETTGAPGFTNKVSLVTSSLAGGDYYIGWSYQWSYDSSTSDFVGQVTLDGTASLMEHRQEPKDSGGAGPGGTDQKYQVSGHDVITLAAGVHTINIDYASGGGSTAAIWNARLVLWRTV